MSAAFSITVSKFYAINKISRRSILPFNFNEMFFTRFVDSKISGKNIKKMKILKSMRN